MKNIGLVLLLLGAFQWAATQGLDPYILGFESMESIDATKENVVKNLTQNGIEVVGQYSPAEDANRWVIIISSPELKSAVQTVGGLTGFAATLRVGITLQNDTTFVSYTNPEYWGNAYFRDDFDKVATNYSTLTTHIENAMKASGAFLGTPFGSKKGLEIAKLRKYRYMVGMPDFDNTKELGEFASYDEALAKIASSIKSGVPDVELVYEMKIPGKGLTLYGFALSGEDGEGKFLPIIDISHPKHTAFLPYEVLVMGNEVHMLHGRYRIALSFPDLTMGTFTKIMSTPGNIEDLLEQLVEED